MEPSRVAWYDVTLLSTVTSQQEGLDSNLLTNLGLSAWSFHVLPIPAWVSYDSRKTCRLDEQTTLNWP